MSVKMESFLSEALANTDERLLKPWLGSLKKQRHDFMNDIQVIWGYLSINQTENAVYYIHQIIQRQERIARIQLLEHEPLVLYLLTYNDVKRKLTLEADVDPCFSYQGLKIDGSTLFNVICQLVSIYEAICRPLEDSETLSLFIDRIEEGLLLTCHFEGEGSENRIGAGVSHLLAQNKAIGMRLVEEDDADGTLVKLYIS